MSRDLEQSEILPLIRSKVRDRLLQSAAFRALPKEKRASIAHDTVNALHYIVGGEDGESRPSAVTLAGNAPFGSTPEARALAGSQAGGGAKGTPSGGGAPAPGGGKPTSGNGTSMPGFGDAARDGSDALTSMVANVDFPGFVSGLIDGVFNSIVSSSIKQMEAYGELVKNVSKSVDQYMKDNVTENQARDYLAECYPDHLEVDIAGESPRLKPRENADEQPMPDFFSDLGLKTPVNSIDEDNVEQELVPAARRRIAMDRQQLLATMVMMGVNRLVVTNGTIEASCLFELDTTDLRTSHANQTRTQDWARSRESEWGRDGGTTSGYKSGWKGKGSGNGWEHSYDGSANRETKSSWFSKGASKESANFKVTTVRSQDAEEKIQLHAQLGGKVKVNFKSDYFPMERMIDALQINQIRERTAAAASPATPAIAAPPIPPPPPLPAPAIPGMPFPPGAGGAASPPSR